jgi:hypothetical protein
MSEDGTIEFPNRWPPGFSGWPHDEQINLVERRMTRKGIIEDLLNLSGLDTRNYELRDDSKLRKKELAAIYLKMEGISNVSE